MTPALRGRRRSRTARAAAAVATVAAGVAVGVMTGCGGLPSGPGADAGQPDVVASLEALLDDTESLIAEAETELDDQVQP